MQTKLPKKATATKTATAPSIMRRWASAAVTAEEDENKDDRAASSYRQQPVPRRDEPNLFNFPADFHPVYRPLPPIFNLVLVIISMFLSAILTWEHLTWLDPLMSVRAGIRTWNIKKLVKFAGKALIASFLSTTLLQDAFFPPTRISTAQLMQKYFLPSAISRYEKIPLPKRGDTLGVHFLKCQVKEEGPVRFQALHCNHGFGASCLSWLPTLPSLMDRLGARVALAHDAPGFGFTDRSDNITTYTRGTSAEIGTQLLQSALGGDHKSTSVALFGHSMGAAATLRMALALPKETRRFIVLVGPALGLIHEPVKVKSRLRSCTRPARQFVRRYLFDPTFGYVLRRTVGIPTFWKSSLRQFWGDANRLSDSDVLRFQWPSIGAGWERGLLSYTLAQARQGSSDGISDEQLMERVLELPNTTVHVIRGEKDIVVPKRLIDSFFCKFPDVKIHELKGQGHDPFEEQVQVFVETVGRILDDENV